jgi:ABC-type bacteriocin/lantibiotic exporter with double-glycine peptidase domain
MRILIGFGKTYLRPYVGMCAGILLLMIVSMLLDLAPVHLTRMVIDSAIAAGSLSMLAGLAAVFIGALLISAVVEYVLTILCSRTSQRIVLDIRSRLVDHLMALGPTFYRSQDVGKVANRVMGDVSSLESFLTSSLFAPWLHLGTAGVLLAYLFVMDRQLALVAAAAVPFYLLATIAFQRPLNQASLDVQQRQDDVYCDLLESIRGLPEIQAFANEQAEVAQFRRVLERYFRSEMQLIKVDGLAGGSVSLVQGLATVAVLCVGGWLSISRGQPKVGELMAFLMALGQLLSTSRGFTGVFMRYFQVEPVIRRLNEYFEAAPDIVPSAKAEPLRHVGGALATDEVEFAYEFDRPALAGVSLQVAPGQMVALVGTNGAGKSTIMKMFLRIFDPQKGRVLIDGRDVRQFALSDLRRSMGVVTQNSAMFNATVRENILFWREARPEQFNHALQFSTAEEVVFSLGLDRPPGRLVKGHEQSKIIKARALLKIYFEEADIACFFVFHDSDGVNPNLSLRQNIMNAHRRLPINLDEGANNEVLATVRTILQRAVCEAGIQPLVREAGLEHPVSLDPCNLSGGQIRRLCLARALISQPAIFLLDEPTTGIDPVSVSAIRQAILNMPANANGHRPTRLLVSHDLSLIREADQILVFDGGRIVERGKHDDLLAAKHLYYQLVRSQETGNC